MCVPCRIKVLDCQSFQEAETKVNRFLETDESIRQLVNIQYNLEYGNVIVEYNISEPHNNPNNNNNNNNDDDNTNLIFNPYNFWWLWPPHL